MMIMVRSQEKMKMTEHDLVILGHDVHQTQLAGDLGIAARAFEIQVAMWAPLWPLSSLCWPLLLQ